MKNSNKSLKIISYHIPKTAGTSFRIMLENEYGKSAVTKVYDAQLVRQINGGTIPNELVRNVIHGHFKPNPKHLVNFPTAKSIVWVRDPIERIWSHVSHLMRYGRRHPQFNQLFNANPKYICMTKEQIVSHVIESDEIMFLTRAYQRFFENLPLDQLDFIGSTHAFKRHIDLLNDMISSNLVAVRMNTGQQDKIPISLRSLEHFLESEYELVANYL